MSGRDPVTRSEAGTLGQRPRYHVTAPRNWLNDPNGPIRHDGRYHLFYQYNPHAPVWGPPSWGHVSSADLAHWTDHAVALAPRPDGPDRDGCWSGCARLIDGRPTIFYTGVVEVDGRRTESVCVAHGSADLIAWEQAPRPIIPGPPPEISGGYHRDPFVFGGPGAWRMLIASGLHDEDGARSGAILHYASKDATSWSYRGVLLRRPAGVGPIDTGPLWECPQIFRSGGEDVIIHSVQMENEGDPLVIAVYTAGTLGEAVFEPRTLGLVDHGSVFYAPAIAPDDDGRVLMWGWIQEKHGSLDVDHNGALSLPRVVDLIDGRLRVAPAPELRALRTATLEFGDVASGARLDLAEPPGLAGGFELTATVPAGATVEVGLVAGDRVTYRLAMDLARATARVQAEGSSPLEVPLAPRDPVEDRTIRLYVDASILELFLDDEVAVTSRCYAPAASRIEVAGVGVGDGVALRGVELHTLGDALPERRPGT